MTPRHQMRRQDPKKRIKNFEEVALGYSEDEATAEALRCLLCKSGPCKKGCPVEIDITDFIQKIREKKFKQAYEKLREKNNLPAICGRVCPQEDQCEKFCILSKKDKPVAIGRLERFIADWAIKNELVAIEKAESKKAKGAKVGIIGAGPSGLTCAADLARMGYQVTIFESLHATGGVLRYGIPEFRLPKKIVDIEVESIEKLGVKIKVNFVAGKSKTLEQLRTEGYKAFFIGTGSGSNTIR